MRGFPIDQLQNATPRAAQLHELKNVQLQECFTPGRSVKYNTVSMGDQENGE